MSPVAAADRVGPRAERPQAARDPRAVGAGRQPQHHRAAERRAGGVEPVGAHERHAALVLQRAHDADDAEAHLARRARLDRERRARPQPERVGQPDADLGLARRRARAGPAASGGASKRVWSPG